MRLDTFQQMSSQQMSSACRSSPNEDKHIHGKMQVENGKTRENEETGKKG